jgi:hypothetical protein
MLCNRRFDQIKTRSDNKSRNLVSLRAFEPDKAWLAKTATKYGLLSSDISRLTQTLQPLDHDSMSRVSSSLDSLEMLVSHMEARGVIRHSPIVLTVDLVAWFDFLSEIGLSKEQIVLILQQVNEGGGEEEIQIIFALHRHRL